MRYDLTPLLAFPFHSPSLVLHPRPPPSQEKCDRLVELILKYDERTRLAEYQFYRSDGAEEVERTAGLAALDLAALDARLRGGADVLHRACAVAAFAGTGSRRCHGHLLEQLQLKEGGGMVVVRTALEEFASLLGDGEQKEQLRRYSAAL